jgi:hypothetical protein
MAKCIYCGKSAGLFSNQHEACLQAAEKNRAEGVQRVKDYVFCALEKKQAYTDVQSDLREITSKHQLSWERVGRALLDTVSELARLEPLEPTKCEYLIALCEETLGTWQTISRDSPFYTLLGPRLLDVSLSGRLWQVMHRQPVHLTTPCDVVLQAGEIRLAEFGSAMYRKSVTASSFGGGYNGVGVRLAPGVYYRFGGFGGQSARTPQLQYVDSGFLVLTDRGMYFAGQRMTFRIPYGAVLRYKAYPDGLGFFRGSGDGREEIFTVADPVLSNDGSGRYNVADATTLQVGWFLYNLAQFQTAPSALP